MKLLIKQRVFSWGSKYDIYDEDNQVRYEVRGEVFSWGHKIHVYDAYENEIGMIRQKLLNLTPTFEIDVQGRTLGKIKKRFTLFHPSYDIDFNGWEVDGDFWGWDYNVYDGGQAILNISKVLFQWGDTYVIDIPNSDHELMGMMLVIAIDAANATQNK